MVRFALATTKFRAVWCTHVNKSRDPLTIWVVYHGFPTNSAFQPFYRNVDVFALQKINSTKLHHKNAYIHHNRKGHWPVCIDLRGCNGEQHSYGLLTTCILQGPCACGRLLFPYSVLDWLLYLLLYLQIKKKYSPLQKISSISVIAELRDHKVSHLVYKYLAA